jgi:hypothetical protein
VLKIKPVFISVERGDFFEEYETKEKEIEIH